jgi:hypothetical protein
MFKNFQAYSSKIPTNYHYLNNTSQMIKTSLMVHHFQIFGDPKYMLTYNAQP